jgi:hypothetical protein
MADDDNDGTELKPDGRGGLTAGGVEKAKKKPGARAAGDEPMDEEKRKKPAEGEDAEKARRRSASEDEDDTEKARRRAAGEDDDETEKARRPKDDDEDEAEKAKQPEEDDEEDDDKKKARKAEPIVLPDSVKEALLRALTEALERLMAVAGRVKDARGARKSASTPVPEDLGAEVRAVAKLLEGAAGPSGGAEKADVAKGGARMAKDRLDRFQKAMAVLAEILKELTDSREAAPAPTAGVAEAGVKKRDAGGASPPAPGLAELVAGIGELTRVVKRQEEELGRIRQARGVSNAIPVDGARRPAPEDVSWPFDMNRPITRDKVKKEVSFFDE